MLETSEFRGKRERGGEMRKERVKHCKRKETPQRNHGGGG